MIGFVRMLAIKQIATYMRNLSEHRDIRNIVSSLYEYNTGKILLLFIIIIKLYYRLAVSNT